MQCLVDFENKKHTLNIFCICQIKFRAELKPVKLQEFFAEITGWAR